VPARLDELAGPEVAERLTAESVLLQPIGAIEQHGPHLPLNTDHVIASELAELVATGLDGEVDLWLLPPIAYSKSNEHAWSPGTVWLSATTLLAVLDDVGRCLATTAARRLVFLNGHGGNSALLDVACRELRLAHGLATFLCHPFLPPDHGGPSTEHELGMGIHAGRDETSMMLHLRPDLVKMDRAERRVPEWLAANEHVRFGGSVSFGWLSDDFDPSGVIGDPTGATAEIGAAHVEAAVAALLEQLREVASFGSGSGSRFG
jgi:creatinine amidohydrolase